MRLFRFLAYCFAFLLGVVFAFRGTNSFPAPPPKQYQPDYQVRNAVKTEPSTVVVSSDVDQGKTLFSQNCATCHNRNMSDDLTGPALGEVADNWRDYPREDLYSWIRNSQAMIETGNPRALEIWKKWQPSVMTAFPNLSDEEIEQIMAYINARYSGAQQIVY